MDKRLGAELPAGLELRFHPDEKDFPTHFDPNEKGIEHPCFVVKGKHKYSDGHTYDTVGYQFYFAYNRAIGIGGILPLSRLLGYHRHDVEGVYVLFDKDQQPKYVYFKAHGTGQGVWRKWTECKEDDGALVVYIALNSHATYPSPGRVARLYGLANDEVADGGKRIHIGPEQCMPAPEEKFEDGKIRTRSVANMAGEIPKLANESISVIERIRLLRYRRAIKDKVDRQYNME